MKIWTKYPSTTVTISNSVYGGQQYFHFVWQVKKKNFFLISDMYLFNLIIMLIMFISRGGKVFFFFKWKKKVFLYVQVIIDIDMNIMLLTLTSREKNFFFTVRRTTTFRDVQLIITKNMNIMLITLTSREKKNFQVKKKKKKLSRDVQVFINISNKSVLLFSHCYHEKEVLIFFCPTSFCFKIKLKLIESAILIDHKNENDWICNVDWFTWYWLNSQYWLTSPSTQGNNFNIIFYQVPVYHRQYKRRR